MNILLPLTESAPNRRRWGVLAGGPLALAGALLALVAVADRAKGGPQPTATISTSMGTIRIELSADAAPATVDNFKKYAKGRFYDGTILHRVIDGFMIQGGGFTPDLKEKTPTYLPIALESKNGLKNSAGTVAMARKADPNSATCQFFINLVDNPNLDYNPNNPRDNGYAVFGKVIAGFDVIDRIRAVKTATRGIHQSVPVAPIVIESVSLEE